MRSLVAGSLVAGVFLAISSAIATPLAMDADAMDGFKGTVAFNAGDLLKVNLDYAVFAPGTYPDDGVNGDDPSDGVEYVYAFQAYNVSADRPLTTVSVCVLDGSGAGNAGSDSLHAQAGGVAPVLSKVLTDSVVFTFIPQVLAGGYSEVFLFTSPNAPTWGDASILDSGLSDQAVVPTPVPEPVTLLALVAGGMVMQIRRRS